VGRLPGRADKVRTAEHLLVRFKSKSPARRDRATRAGAYRSHVRENGSEAPAPQG